VVKVVLVVAVAAAAGKLGWTEAEGDIEASSRCMTVGRNA